MVLSTGIKANTKKATVIYPDHPPKSGLWYRLQTIPAAPAWKIVDNLERKTSDTPITAESS